jgi:predicted DNA-binding protein with PD1-like motif
METLLDLGSGLKVCKVHVDELMEQDINARAMNKKMFDRLTANIKKDGRLESLPFCVTTEKGIEIVSGHHRVRGARSADVMEIFILLDDTGVSRSRIRSKQLSHNSLQGEDNAQLVKQIYEMIEDAEAKLAAFIDADIEIKYDKAKIQNIALDMEIKTILVTFLSYEKEIFDRAAKIIDGKYEELYAADIRHLDLFSKALKSVQKDYDIRAMSTALSMMAEITLKYLGEETDDAERVALRDIFGTSFIPAEAAAIVKDALQKMKKNGDITQTNQWQALEYWAADFLAER